MIIRPIVAYIAYEPYGLDYLERFLKRYNEYPSGYDHELLICFKQFRNKEIIDEWKKKINVKFTEFDDSKNYCPDCGAKHIRNRLTTIILLNQINDQFLSIDNRFLITFLDLFKKPEKVINGYINGLQ